MALSSGGACGYCQSVISLEEIYEIAEGNSLQLRPHLTAEEEAAQEIKVAKNGRLPEINASLSLSYIGDGFITKRDFSDYQKAPIPHFGNGVSVGITQPIYTGGAVTSSIKMAESKSVSGQICR